MRNMPIINVELCIQGALGNGKETQRIDISRLSKSDNCTEIKANQEYTLGITLKRNNRSDNLRAHSPMFARGKDEGWFLVLGDISQGELWALKRSSGVNNQPRLNQLQFTAPAFPGNFFFFPHLVFNKFHYFCF